LDRQHPREGGTRRRPSRRLLGQRVRASPRLVAILQLEPDLGAVVTAIHSPLGGQILNDPQTPATFRARLRAEPIGIETGSTVKDGYPESFVD
jgi:hypothetical protein